MAFDPEKLPKWMGRSIVHDSHSHDLERRAAIEEFQNKLPKEAAEEKAHQQYRREHHVEAAAHHLQGAKAAQGAGDMEEAKKHGAMYHLHMEKLGLDPVAEPPPEIRKQLESPDRKPAYKFKAHKGDMFLLDGGKPTAPTTEHQESTVKKTERPLSKKEEAQAAVRKFWDEKFVPGFVPAAQVELKKTEDGRTDVEAFWAAKHAQADQALEGAVQDKRLSNLKKAVQELLDLKKTEAK